MTDENLSRADEAAQVIPQISLDEDDFVPSVAILQKLKAEVVRIGSNGTREGFEFARRMFERYPEEL